VKGLATAPLAPGDARDVARVWRACELHDDGVGLSTDSRTGARGLYEHVGMRVTRTHWEFAKRL
jgi:hypothetical protein